jgi:DNA-binding NtrC family response regulator
MNINSILIVDDDTMIREVVSEMLKEKIHKIVTVESGNQALKILSRNRFDIILTDINMPDMDGIQLLEYIKFVDPLIPIITMTGCNDLHKMHEAMEKGVAEYVIKPFSKEEICIYIDRTVLWSITKQNMSLNRYVAIANNLISHSNERDKDELVIIGKRFLKYINDFVLFQINQK